MRTVLVVALVACAACGPGRPPVVHRPPTPAASMQSSPTPSAGPVDVYAHDGLGMFAPSVAHITPRVYVPESESSSVAVIDPTTYRVIDRFSVGKRPQHVTPSWDLKTLWVDDNVSNDLVPIDPATGKSGPAVRVDDPYNLYFMPDGSSGIVVNERNRTLSFRDPHNWTLQHQISVPCAGPNHADFDAAEKRFVLSCEFSGGLIEVDPYAPTVLHALHIGGQPIDVKISPDGSVFYVADQSRGGVLIFDAATLQRLAFVPTGAGAHGFVVSRDAKSLYVTNRGAGTISVISFATRSVVATWTTGGSPDMGGINAEGTRLWVSGRYSAAVYVVDTTTGKLLATIPVRAGPHGVCVFPQPGRYSLGHVGAYR